MAGKNQIGLNTLTSSQPVKNDGAVNNAWDLPDIVLKGLDDKTHRLTNWKGKIILLYFWATWCRPCQKEILRSETGKTNMRMTGYKL